MNRVKMWDKDGKEISAHPADVNLLKSKGYKTDNSSESSEEKKSQPKLTSKKV